MLDSGPKTKYAFLVILCFLALDFLPLSSGAQLVQQVNISVSATVSSTSTPPAAFCGDGTCNNGERCSTCPADCGTCASGSPPGGGVVIIPKENKIVFKGKAYPSAVLTISKNDAVISVFRAESSGLFEREISGIAAGIYNFAIFAEDSEGRKSATIGFSAGVLNDKTTTISGIFIPPTIELNSIEAEKGQLISIFGQAFPESAISIFISPDKIVKSASSTVQGKWSYNLDTNLLIEGEHSVRANTIVDEGEQSPFSQTISFLIKKSACRGADLNFDGRVDLVDFSILLYFWGQSKPSNRCADINSDGTVNIVDFSIMMYWWND